jgi:hypothetical protein
VTKFETIDPSALKLPACPIPRPGDRVGWYSGARFVEGDLTGHDINGRPLIISQFGRPVRRDSFHEIRVLDPERRRGPNWNYLPAAGVVVRPPAEMIASFEGLLSAPIPPGPTALDLIREMHHRGFESFIVGGTVRDVLRGEPPQDVDIVTTMPLKWCRTLIKHMFRYAPEGEKTRGYIRIGGTPGSGDPFIDLKVFSDSLPGTPDATFGVGFDRDMAHRDFACNAVYFEPLNRTLVDPSGVGIGDAIARRLRLVCETCDAFQHAQLFIRFFKFCSRGFEPTPETVAAVLRFGHAIRVMGQQVRIKYIRAQILSKCSSLEERLPALDRVADLMSKYGAGHIWQEMFAPHVRDMCDER